MKIKALHSLYLKLNGVSTDTRKIKKNSIFFALKGENFDGNKFAENALRKGARYAVIDDKTIGINDNFILVEDVLKTLQELSTFHRETLKIPIIALTGSNGKTTTKELIHSVLSKKYKTSATEGNLNNHIGVPLTLLKMSTTTEIGIVEMGANHQKEIEFLCKIALPDYGLITNFGKAHLEGFGGIEGVIKGKSEMYVHLRKHGKIIFVNQNDELQMRQSGKYNRTHLFGGEAQLLSTEPFLQIGFNSDKIKTQLTGVYNFNNISVAIAIGEYFKIEKSDIISAIENYIPENNRSQVIKKGGLHITLDAYNANPTSMEAALKSFYLQKGKPKILVLGDMFELGDVAYTEHKKIIELAIYLKFDKLIFVGKNFYEHKDDYSLPIIEFFKTYSDLEYNFNLLSLNDGNLLIKGSRGMALEQIIHIF